MIDTYIGGTDAQSMNEEELLAIIRRAENSHIPGSLYQKARIELDLRDRQKKAQLSGVHIHIGGDNNGVVSGAGRDSIVLTSSLELNEKISALKEAINREASVEQKDELIQLTEQMEKEAYQPTMRQKALVTAGKILSKTSELVTVGSFIIEIIKLLHGQP